MNPQMSRSADVPFTFANMGDQSPMPHPEGRNPPALTFLWKNRRFLPWRPLSLFLYGGMWYAKINEL